MYTALWIVIALQIFMGALDTLLHHESFMDKDINVFMREHLRGAS